MDFEMAFGAITRYFNHENFSIYGAKLPPNGTTVHVVHVSNAAPDPAILFYNKEQVQCAQLYSTLQLCSFDLLLGIWAYWVKPPIFHQIT